MDLTPPSLTRSPTSPTHTYCPSERSSLEYPSPDLAAQQYRIAPLYANDQLCSLSQGVDADVSLPPLDPTTTANWASSNIMAPSSSSLSIPNVLSSEYDPFAEYDPPVSASYGSETYPPPPSHSSTLGHPSHGLTDSPGRSPAPSSSRSSFSYAHSGHPMHLGPRIKMENTSDYGSGIDASHYPSPRSMQAPYMSEPSPYAHNPHGYMSDTQSTGWSKVEYGAEQYYQNPSAGEPAPPPPSSSSSHDAKHGEQPLKHNRPKRTARKMTSLADANYRCDFKGCGKLFSRSYNYKAHLETHDDNRDYPFPCPVADCNKRFVRKTDLQRHNQSVHMKEKNYGCDYCGRLFARKDTLRRHMEDGCSKRFDVGTCDLRVDGYESTGAANRNNGGSMHPIGPVSGPLPPITLPVGNGGGGGNGNGSGLLHPGLSASRSKNFFSTNDGAHGDSWSR
ncbi:Transcriptional regulator prz1 [Colletotrichum chlorophyti]|uniref:Transcriptional regulator prz1 n=1 Tax=Colletotrichum chlorophyti TaxID=708187 RepID=A0A1Q8RYI0_9PEZI|nr:Transcriptional regulator prz1 [Colletotrichum chlorophyti]